MWPAMSLKSPALGSSSRAPSGCVATCPPYLIHEVRMKRMVLMVAVFAGAVILAGSALGQGPGGPGGFKKKKGPPPDVSADRFSKIEAEIANLRVRLRAVEAELRSRPGFAKEHKGYGPPWGKGYYGFGKGKGF